MDSMDESNESKRRRIDEYYGNGNVVNANKIVELHFQRYCRDSPHNTVTKSNPLFTHQIFDGEKIFSKYSEEELKIDIQVCTQDLTQRITVCCPIDEVEELHSKLMQNVPKGTSFRFQDKNGDVIGFRNSTSEGSDDTLDGSLPGFPLGEKISEFRSDDNEIFSMHMSSHGVAGTTDLLARAEKLAVWYIETADAVDFCDDKWQILLCYKVTRCDKGSGCSAHHYELAGYMTLFTFGNPIVGNKLRICQVLVLPNVQRRGIGRRMMLALYRHVEDTCSDISEITVEDPCEGFSALRDVVDTEWALSHSSLLWKNLNLRDDRVTSEGGENSGIPKIDKFLCAISREFLAGNLTKAVCNQCHGSLKLTVAQFKFVLEALTLLHVRHFGPKPEEESNENVAGDVEKPFRLQLKRHLLKENPDVKLLGDKKAIQAEMNRLCGEAVERIETVVQSKCILTALRMDTCESIPEQE